MTDPQTPNPLPGDEFSDDDKNEAIARLLERLRRIDETDTAAPAQRSHPQLHITPMRPTDKPLETPHPAAYTDEPLKDTPPAPEEPVESDPLPINTRYEHMQNLRRARQQQARAARRRAWKDLQQQTGQQLTRAVDFSNRWINRLVSFAAGVGATCLVLLFIQFWVASDTTHEIQPVKTSVSQHTNLLAQTVTPPPTLAVIRSADVRPWYGMIPLHTHPNLTGCWVRTENIEISPNIPYKTGDEPTLRLWTQVDTEGCEGRSLRVSLSLTRGDGQPLIAQHNGWLLDLQNTNQLTVEGALSVRDGSSIPIVLELPHRRFPLAPGLHSLSGYLQIRDEDTNITLYDTPLEPFMLPIAP